jgi:hypothetical protein
MRLALLALCLLCRTVVAGESLSPYLPTVRLFLDTMIEKGTDRYGDVRSPLFAAMLDLETLSLPVASLPPEFFRGEGMHSASGFGLPDPPVGIRPTDRSPVGNNLEHDILLLRTMFEFSALTGEPRYAAHADAYLRFWLRNCQSAETGLMAAGEHSSWDFLRERAYGGIHEASRRFPFWDKLYAIDPARTLRIADGLWLSQIGNHRVGDYSRHAYIEFHRPDTGAAYPRHAGFYIWAYANAFVHTRDPKYIERAEVLIESRTAVQPQPFSLLIEPAGFRPEQSADPTLRLLLWDSAGLIPSRREAWRAIVRQLDERARANPESEKLASSSIAPTSAAEHQKRKEAFARLEGGGRELLTSGGIRTRSTSLSPLWSMGYGSSGVSGRALLDYTRWRQNGDRRFLEAATAAADGFLKEGVPADKKDLWPGACGQVISLLAALSTDKAIPASRQASYLVFARQVADMSVPLFQRNGLFRADGTARHYEAITGADDLLWGLLQLHCTLAKAPRQLIHNDVNW